MNCANGEPTELCSTVPLITIESPYTNIAADSIAPITKANFFTFQPYRIPENSQVELSYARAIGCKHICDYN